MTLRARTPGANSRGGGPTVVVPSLSPGALRGERGGSDPFRIEAASCTSSVDRKNGAGHEAGAVGQEVGHDVGDLVGAADPAEGMELGHLPFCPGRRLRAL